MSPRPCLVSDCPEKFDAAPLLAAHLASAHLWNGSTAYLRARTAFLKEEPASTDGGRARRKDPEEAVDVMTKEEEPLPSKKGQYQPSYAERTCGACGKKRHRRDHCPEGKPAAARDGKPPTAKAAPTCGYCHRPEGSHSKGCKRGPCKFCAKVAPKRCKHHSGERGKPGPKGLRVDTKGKVTVAVSDQYLTKLKAAIAEHERIAAALREALAILE